MNAGVWYVDTSAIAALVVAEGHSPALVAWASDNADALVASDLVRTELLRATRRVAPELVERAQAALDTLDLLPLARGLFRTAALLGPPDLGALDALHLAAALELGDDLEGLVTYDQRLAAVARAHGLHVVAPGS